MIWKVVFFGQNEIKNCCGYVQTMDFLALFLSLIVCDRVILMLNLS